MKLFSNFGNRYQALRRDPTNGVIAGVCSGIGKSLNVDATIVRMVFLGLALLSGLGIVMYLLLFFVMSDEAKSLFRNSRF